VQRRARVIAVTSGKGGVGKTSTSVNLGIALVAQGKRVVVIDADLGLANVEVLMGLNALNNLQSVIDGERKLNEVLVRGPGGLEIVPGSSGIATLADLGPQARQRVIDGLEELMHEVDFIILDTMAGIGQNSVAFCAAADEVLLVTTPEPSAIVDAYAMMKTVYQVRDDVAIRMVVNMVANEEQARAVGNKLSRVAQQYLSRQVTCLGYILRDSHVSQAVMQSNPFILRFPTSPASKCIHALATRIIHQRIDSDSERNGFLRRFARAVGFSA
jgi:flagellar biosynthesis protein FlhG